MGAGAIMSEEGAGFFLAYPIWLAFEVVVGVAGLWVAAKLLLGGAGPLLLAIVRLAGLYAVSDAVYVVIPLPIIGYLASVVVYIGLLASLFDFELGEAIAVGLITFVLKVLASWIVVAMFMG